MLIDTLLIVLLIILLLLLLLIYVLVPISSNFPKRDCVVSHQHLLETGPLYRDREEGKRKLNPDNKKKEGQQGRSVRLELSGQLLTADFRD